MKKRLLPVLLALVMVLGMLPLAVFAMDDVSNLIPEGEANIAIVETGNTSARPNRAPAKAVNTMDLTGSKITPITGAFSTGTVVEGTETAEVNVVLANDLTFSPERAAGNGSTYRKAGWWVGMNIYAPTNFVPMSAVYQRAGVESDLSFNSFKDGDNWIQVWGYVDEAMLKSATDKTVYTYKWYFDWDGDKSTGTSVTHLGASEGSTATMEGVDQTVSLTFSLGNVKLMKDGKVFWQYTPAVEVSAVNGVGTVEATTAEGAITAAAAEANKTVTFEVKDDSATKDQATGVTLPKESISAASTNQVSVAVATPNGTVTLDEKAVAAVAKVTDEGAVSITVEDKGEVTVGKPEAAKDDTFVAYDVEVKVGNTPVSTESWGQDSNIQLVVPKPESITTKNVSAVKVYLDDTYSNEATVGISGTNLVITVPHLTQVGLAVPTALAQYTIKFAPGEHGQGSMNDVTVNKAATGATEYTVPTAASGFTAPGYTFKDWEVSAVDADGEAVVGLKIENGKISIPADSTAAVITLTATWEKDTSVEELPVVRVANPNLAEYTSYNPANYTNGPWSNANAPTVTKTADSAYTVNMAVANVQAHMGGEGSAVRGAWLGIAIEQPTVAEGKTITYYQGWGDCPTDVPTSGGFSTPDGTAAYGDKTWAGFYWDLTGAKRDGAEKGYLIVKNDNNITKYTVNFSSVTVAAATTITGTADNGKLALTGTAVQDSIKGQLTENSSAPVTITAAATGSAAPTEVQVPLSKEALTALNGKTQNLVINTPIGGVTVNASELVTKLGTSKDLVFAVKDTTTSADTAANTKQFTVGFYEDKDGTLTAVTDVLSSSNNYTLVFKNTGFVTGDTLEITYAATAGGTATKFTGATNIASNGDVTITTSHLSAWTLKKTNAESTLVNTTNPANGTMEFKEYLTSDGKKYAVVEVKPSEGYSVGQVVVTYPDGSTAVASQATKNNQLVPNTYVFEMPASGSVSVTATTQVKANASYAEGGVFGAKLTLSKLENNTTYVVQYHKGNASVYNSVVLTFTTTTNSTKEIDVLKCADGYVVDLLKVPGGGSTVTSVGALHWVLQGETAK